MRSYPSITHTDRRAPLAAIALVLAIVVGAVHTPSAAAQPAPQAQRPAAGTASIEGSWSLSFPNEEATTRQLAAFLPGGVVIATNAPSFSEETAAGGRVHSAEGLGAWERLADGRYAFTVVFLYFDAEENNWGALTIDGVVTLDADGDQFSGTFSVGVTDALGTELFTDEEDHLTGSRIRPQTRG